MRRPPSFWAYAAIGIVLCVYSTLSLPFRRVSRRPSARRAARR